MAWSSDREGLSVGPSSVAYAGPSSAGPSDRDVSSTVPPLTGQSSIQSSRAPSEVRPISSLPTGSSMAGPSTLRPQAPLPRREQAVPSEDVAMRKRQPSPPPLRSDLHSWETPARGKRSARGRGGKRMGVPRPPAPPGDPYLAAPENQPWPVVINTPPTILKDDVPLRPETPEAEKGHNSPRTESDDGASSSDSQPDHRTPSERARDAQRQSEAFWHRMPGYIPDLIGMWVQEGGSFKEQKDSF